MASSQPHALMLLFTIMYAGFELIADCFTLNDAECMISKRISSDFDESDQRAFYLLQNLSSVQLPLSQLLKVITGIKFKMSIKKYVAVFVTSSFK